MIQAAFHTGRDIRWRGHPGDAHHDAVTVDVGHVEREPHPDRVHPPAWTQHDGTVDAVPTEQAPSACS